MLVKYVFPLALLASPAAANVHADVMTILHMEPGVRVCTHHHAWDSKHHVTGIGYSPGYEKCTGLMQKYWAAEMALKAEQEKNAPRKAALAGPKLPVAQDPAEVKRDQGVIDRALGGN